MITTNRQLLMVELRNILKLLNMVNLKDKIKNQVMADLKDGTTSINELMEFIEIRKSNKSITEFEIVLIAPIQVSDYI